MKLSVKAGETEHGDRVYLAGTGMSLRDWFAGQALAGMYAGSRAMLKSLAADAKQHGELRTAPTFAREAFECADAMLEARKR